MLKIKKKIKNKIELISIHIPKTAGTSFRNILKRVYGEESVVRFDILNEPTRIMLENKQLNRPKLARNIKVLHGHFNYKDLVHYVEIKKNVPIITWLRDPVERVISNYFYLAKRLKEELQEEEKGLNILAKMQKSLIEYARLEMNRNRMSKFLEGISLDQMKFVGIQEYFNEDLDYFAQLFDIDDIKSLEQNVTGEKHKVSDEILQDISEYNELDMQLYFKALELRKKRLEKTP